MPPVLGWSSMDGDVGPEALILFSSSSVGPPASGRWRCTGWRDYRKSGLPMLPVTHGNEFTRLQVFCTR